MSRADDCKALAAEVGWSEAVRITYGQDKTTAKEYAVYLRSHGFQVRQVACLCKLRFGVGSIGWVVINTDKEQYKKHLKRNAKYARRRGRKAAR